VLYSVTELCMATCNIIKAVLEVSGDIYRCHQNCRNVTVALDSVNHCLKMYVHSHRPNMFNEKPHCGLMNAKGQVTLHAPKQRC